jgi:hypothetical protein
LTVSTTCDTIFVEREVGEKEKQMKHTQIANKRIGSEKWLIKCSCGRQWTGWRWLVEEQFSEHSDPAPTYEEMHPEPRWHDDTSYAAWQARP